MMYRDSAPLRSLLLPLLIAAVAVASVGCRRATIIRAGTPEEQAAYVRTTLIDGRGLMTQYPANAAGALEAADSVLALDENNLAAHLLATDALFELRRYKDMMHHVYSAVEIAPEDIEVLYREARAYYWFHTLWTKHDYADARAAAERCLAAGDKYLIECYAIIRNSYLGEDVENGPSRAAYQRAADSAEELLNRLDELDARRGDVLLVLAEMYDEQLGDATRSRLFLAGAKAFAQRDDSLARRVAAFERDRDLRAALAN